MTRAAIRLIEEGLGTSGHKRADAIHLNPIVLGELFAGFARGTRQEENRAELRAFLSSPRVHVLDIDEETAERYAAILISLWAAGTPIPTNALWIAASAMQHGARILTTDAHYRKVAQVLVDHHDPEPSGP